jgi:hypothetical protein
MMDTIFDNIIEGLKSASYEILNILDDYEGIMTDYEGDTACITISVDNFTDMELFAIEDYTSDVIDDCNYHKPQYELINIEVLDDVVILKVKV